MVDRASNTQLLSFFTDHMHSKKLDLNPIWQRKPGIWTTLAKQHLIDSILRNYPFPTILLNARTSDDGITVYEVVDGKQRLSTILEFVTDELGLGDESSDLGLPEYFSDFTPEQKATVYGYTVTVELIKRGSLEELGQAFDRLNRNVARLNAQELRHALYYGRFIQLMESLADDDFWSDVGIATAARRRRMLDVQFVSQIFILTMRGIQDGDGQMDAIYAEYDEEIADERQHTKTYRDCLRLVKELDGGDGLIRETRLGNLADLYSLWAAIRLEVVEGTSEQIDLEGTKAALRQFAAEVSGNPSSGDAARYLAAAKQGSNKGSNRIIRCNLLRQHIARRSP